MSDGRGSGWDLGGSGRRKTALKSMEFNDEMIASIVEEHALDGLGGSMDIIWKFKTGDFHWYHFEVKEIEYNKLARY